MKIYLDSIGCRLNQAEIEAYARQFRAYGHTLVEAPHAADLVVINTCTVTAAADSDSRKKIRRAARAGADKVVVTGCWSTLNPAQAASLPGVSDVVPNAEKDDLVDDALRVSSQTFELEPIERVAIPGARFRTRLFVKVQDGCDNRCTFCITTIARGASRSRTTAEIVADLQAALRSLSDNGSTSAAKEVVLTGVHLGTWGHDLAPQLHLSDLVRALLEHTDVPRIRLSSLEPWDINNDFFDLWQDPRICRHLHLPLQSGCAQTLRRMARKTTPQEYANLVRTARESIPGVAVTTDVITGFPGESEREFTQNLDFIREMHFAGGHVFTYSMRKGTAAALMPDHLPHGIRKQRNAQVRQIFAESASSYRSQFVGHVLPVLWESATAFGPDGWEICGLTDNYLRVKAISPQRLWNEITPVYMTQASAGGMLGELID